MESLTFVIFIVSEKITVRLLPHNDNQPASQPITDHYRHIFHASQKNKKNDGTQIFFKQDGYGLF